MLKCYRYQILNLYSGLCSISLIFLLICIIIPHYFNHYNLCYMFWYLLEPATSPQIFFLKIILAILSTLLFHMHFRTNSSSSIHDYTHKSLLRFWLEYIQFCSTFLSRNMVYHFICLYLCFSIILYFLERLIIITKCLCSILHLSPSLEDILRYLRS